MAGLLDGVLPAIYSASNTAKRRLNGLLADPAGTLGLGLNRFAEDNNSTLNLMANAYPMAGDKTVLNSPKQNALARALLADKGTDMAMAGMVRNGQSTAEWAGHNTPDYIGTNHANDMMQILKEDIATKDFNPSGLRQGLIDWSQQSNIHPRYALQAFIRNLNADKELSQVQKSKIFQSLNP